MARDAKWAEFNKATKLIVEWTGLPHSQAAEDLIERIRGSEVKALHLKTGLPPSPELDVDGA